MSENAFYDLIKRYSEEESLKDKSSKPKNPAHKLSQEEKQTIINKAREEREKIKALQSAFETDMQDLGKNISIGKSRVHEIPAGIYDREQKIETKSNHLSRPEKPLASFSMDFTQKRIGNGDTGYVFGLLNLVWTLTLVYFLI